MKQDEYATGLVEHSERLKMTGLEFVEAMGTKKFPLPPIAGVLPFKPSSWDIGFAEFLATPDDNFANPMHTTHGGWALTMIDTATAIAGYTTLKQGESLSTLETSAKFIRPITPKCGELIIIGKVINRGRTIITLEGSIKDKNDKIYVHGTSSCHIIS